MLTKNDLKQIEGIIKTAFTDFYDGIFEPYVERNEKEHKEIIIELRESRAELVEHIKDREKRITKLERVTGV